MTGEHIPNAIIAELIDSIGLSIDMPFNTIKLVCQIETGLFAAPFSCHKYNRRIVWPFTVQHPHNPFVGIHMIHRILPYPHFIFLGLIFTGSPVLGFRPVYDPYFLTKKEHSPRISTRSLFASASAILLKNRLINASAFDFDRWFESLSVWIRPI
jgi:hypothetical protein